MKRGFILTAIILWVLVVVVIIGIIVIGVKGGFDNMMVTGELVKKENVLPGSAQDIIIESTHQSIEIYKTNSDEINIKQYGNVNTADEDLFSVSTSGDNIYIYFNRNYHINLFSFNFVNDRLVIEIPESYTGDLNVKSSSGNIKTESKLALTNISLQSSSGSIHVNKDISAKTLNAHASSGSIYFDSDVVVNGDITVKNTSGSIKFKGIIKADNLKAEASSGSIHFDGRIELNGDFTVKNTSGSIKFNETINADSLTAEASSGTINASADITLNGNARFKNTSGSIKIQGLTAKDLYAKASSGGIYLGVINVETYNLENTSSNINADNISGGGDIKSSSGSIHISLKNPKGDINLNTTSGNIKVILESSLQFTLNAATTSGGIHTNFATEKNEKGNKATANIGSNPTVSITAKASSGSVRVEN